jgi:DNA-binding HxlR family transcriptional regulator
MFIFEKKYSLKSKNDPFKYFYVLFYIMKELVPFDKIIDRKEMNPSEKAIEEKLIPIPSNLYYIIQKHKREKLKGKPKGISNSFCKLFILAQLMGEKLTFDDIRSALKKELGYRQKRGLHRHLSELLEKGLIKKENGYYQLPEVDLKYVKRVYDCLVHNNSSEYEFYWLFQEKLPKDIFTQWTEYRAKTLREEFAKGDKKAIEFNFVIKMDLVSDSITKWMIELPKCLDLNFLIKEVEHLNRLKKDLEDFRNHPKILRKFKYKLEVLIEIMERLITAYKDAIQQVKIKEVLFERLKERKFRKAFEKITKYLDEANFSESLAFWKEMEKYKRLPISLKEIDKIITKVKKQYSYK